MKVMRGSQGGGGATGSPMTQNDRPASGRAEGGSVICLREVQLVGAMVTDGLNVSSIDSAIPSWLKVKLEGCRWKSSRRER